MPGQTDSYKSIPFPAARKVIVDGLRYGSRRHLVYGLVELDVTRPRELIRQHKAHTGESLSFTAYIVTCFAHAVAANPSVQRFHILCAPPTANPSARSTTRCAPSRPGRQVVLRPVG